MQLENSFTVPVGLDDAWKVLLDIEQVAPCMPGAALETVDGDDFTGLVKVKLGPISLTYKGKASFVEKDEAAHRASIDAQGKDSRGNGTAAAKVTATLTSLGAASTRVDVITDLNITGKPAQFGRGVMVDVGNKLIGQFADTLAAKLTAGEGGAASATAAAAGAPAKTAPAPAKTTPAAAANGSSSTATTAAPSAPAKTTAPAKAAPAKAAPANAAAAESAAVTIPDAPAAPEVDLPAAASDEPAAPVTPSGPRTIAAREVEPIDLMASAGPALAKRLVPLGAGAALLAAIVFFVLRRRR
jgi:carbon monoxide dehydrogenase subunit G